LAPELIRLGVLTPLDRDALATYCEAVTHYRQAAELIDRSSVLVKSASGRLVKNPALQVARDQAAIIKGFARELGLTPSSRSGISVPEAEDDALAELLS
jgi:P27 family predicted phage terminase small subunit